MKVDTKGNTTVIKDTKHDLNEFVANVTQEYKMFESKNLIVDLSGHGHVPPAELTAFLPIAKSHKKAKKSFVIVADTLYDKASDKLVVVPTVLEAHDLIEMDEIERDLGF